MSTTKETQCDIRKLVLVEQREENGFLISVWMFPDKRNIKRYCNETELPFKLGLQCLT